MASRDSANGRAVFAAEAAAVPQARQRLGATLDRFGVDPAKRQTALLLLSEVMTNAVKHGSRVGDRISLAWTLDRDVLKVAVVDSASDAGGPVVIQPDEGREEGRGMLIVDEVAESWSERAVGGCRQVSFRVRL
jgi:anti-sigma regulatory factor (Ser/Thr protein kinase)